MEMLIRKDISKMTAPVRKAARIAVFIPIAGSLSARADRLMFAASVSLAANTKAAARIPPVTTMTILPFSAPNFR